MKFLFVADPLETLSPHGDSSLVMAATALEKGHEVFWACEWEISYHGGEVRAQAIKCEPFGIGKTPETSITTHSVITEFDAVFIRKDPPFDHSYIRLCWFLALAEPKVLFVNRPSLLLRYHEKLLALEAVSQGYLSPEYTIATHLGDLERAQGWVNQHSWQDVVSKPLLGYGGRDVKSWERDSFVNYEVKPEMDDELSDMMVQPFESEVIEKGDRRVFFLNGELLGHFLRIPKQGDFVSNLAQGGTAKLGPLDTEEQESCAKLGRFLKDIGVCFAGADMIGSRVSEVNITSPTGLMNLIQLEQKNYATKLIDSVVKQSSEFHRAAN